MPYSHCFGTALRRTTLFWYSFTSKMRHKGRLNRTPMVSDRTHISKYIEIVWGAGGRRLRKVLKMCHAFQLFWQPL